MPNSCSHDWVDILAAVGPTLATVFAGVVAIVVYVRGEKFQQFLVRPLLVVKHQIDPDVEGNARWILRIQNEGQGSANIDSFTIVANHEIVSPEPMQSPNEYWQAVLYTLGVSRVRTLTDGHLFLPPVSVPATESVVLFDANMQGQHADLSKAISRLEVRIRYRSVLGQTFVIRHRYGHAE